MEEHRKKVAIAALVASSGYLVTRCIVNRKKKRNRTIWKKEWLSPSRGQYANILQELRPFAADYKQYLKMNESTFEELLEKVRPFITKKTTRLRKPMFIF